MDVVGNKAGRILRPALFFIGACCASVLVGCGQPLRVLPPAGLTAHREIAVFHDGFHSGLLLPWPDPELAFLDQRTDDAPAHMPWIEIGFGADAWTRLGGGSSVAARLFFGSSAAVLMLRHHPDLNRLPTDDGAPHIWKFSLNHIAWQRLVTHLNARIDHDMSYPRRPGATDWVVFASEKWSVLHNCHDWTADALTALGLAVDYQAVRTNGNFRNKLEAMQTQLALGGVTVIGPAPDDDHSKR